MCKCASGIFTLGHKYHWSKTSDSHNHIIEEHKLCSDGVLGPNVIPFEISPPNGDLSLPLDQWVYRLDDTVRAEMLPEWYDAEEAERQARLMLVKWAKCKLKGWRLHEAFHPVHPFKIKTKRMSKKRELTLLRDWASVLDSLQDSVRASVQASVLDSVRAAVWVSLRDSVQDSVWESVKNSVWNLVQDSVWDSVGAYTGSLFPNITDWKYLTDNPAPWNSLRELWLSGRMPSFDGKVWRIHAGPKAAVLHTYTEAEVK